MKNLKSTNWVLIILALFIVFGCENANDKEGAGKKEVIKIGAILPLTGPASSAGIDSKNGLTLAIKEIKNIDSSGAIEYQLSIEDSKAQAKEGINALNKLNISTKPQMIYSQLSNVSLSIKPMTEAADQILIAVSGASNLVEGASLTYRNYINPTYYAEVTSQIIKDSFRLEKIGIFYPNTEFGSSIKDNIVNSISNKNISISFQTTYDDQANDYRNTILKALSEDTELNDIYVIGVGKSLGTLIKQLQETGFSGRIIGGIELPYPDVLNLLSNSSKQNIFYVDFAFNPKENSNPKNLKFVKNYQSLFNGLPTTSAAIAYDAASLFFVAISKQGIKNINLNELNFPIKGVTGNIYVKGNEIYYELSLKKLPDVSN